MFGNIGMSELMIILIVVLLLFGPKKLPELARSLGRSINEFKKAADDVRKELNVVDDLKKM
jgi:sec-independent protein translocase protein TatA